MLQSLFQELKIRFEVEKPVESTLLTKNEFYKKIDKSIKQAEEVRTKIILKNEQKEFLDLCSLI